MCSISQLTFILLNEVSINLGLVLTGGGARSAYQAGVLRGLHQVAVEEKLGDQFRFNVFSGISGGAINASYLASHADTWDQAIESLWQRWQKLTLEAVVETDVWPLLKKVTKVGTNLGFGGVFWKKKKPTELLSSEPLRKMLAGGSNFERFQNNLKSGLVQGLGLTATHYGYGTSVTFYQGQSNIKSWARRNRIGLPTVLSNEHVMASAAIPFLFPPILIDGAYYGDGAMRMSAPLSPAIHMGAHKILAIGVRYSRSESEVYKRVESPGDMKSVSLADIAGATLNALFLDAVDSDVERLERINRTLSLIHEDKKHPEALKNIPVLIVRPSQDLGALAKGQLSKFSWTMRHLLRGLGASEERGSDLISYLAFDHSYTGQLLELGYKDALNQRQSILEWLKAP